MKKKFLGIVAAVAVVAIAGVNYLQMNQSAELSDLALANVEALIMAMVAIVISGSQPIERQIKLNL